MRGAAGCPFCYWHHCEGAEGSRKSRKRKLARRGAGEPVMNELTISSVCERDATVATRSGDLTPFALASRWRVSYPLGRVSRGHRGRARSPCLRRAVARLAGDPLPSQPQTGINCPSQSPPSITQPPAPEHPTPSQYSFRSHWRS